MAADPTGKIIDTSAAKAFEAILVPTIFGPWSRALVDLADPKPGDRLLDVGCGTGAAARYAAELIQQQNAVAAIDSDAGMIAHARTLDPSDAVDWHEGDILSLSFDDGVFKHVIGNQVLQFLNDRKAALIEVQRVMTQDGIAIFGVYCSLDLCPAHGAVAQALEKHDIDPAGIQRPYAFNDPMVLGDLMAEAGFRDISVVRRTMEARFASPKAFVEALAAGGPSARHALEQLDKDGLSQVITEVTDTLDHYMDEDGLRVITASNIAVGRR
jgi:ubiquinone/menaquinone biosynthesis C-methylase UbiE